MVHWLKENWFKIGFLTTLFIAALPATIYYLYFLPNRRSSEMNLIVNQELAKQNFQMQEKCEKAADDFFKEGWNGYGDIAQGQSQDYTSHYNQKLNKCFMYLRSLGLDASNTTIYDELYDVFERKTYGTFDKILPNGKADYEVKPTQCSMLEKWCNTQEEFETFVKIYMED